MKQFIIIGLGSFGASIAEELVQLEVELILVDSSESRIDAWKHRVEACYVINEEEIDAIKEIVPEKVSACVIDLGENLELSILLTHHLKKQGCEDIMVRAYSQSHAEIVTLLGATKVVFPDHEAAKRLVPSLVNNGLISYTPVGGGLAFAEVPVAEALVGQSVRNAGFRDRFELNIIATRSRNAEDFRIVKPDDLFHAGDVLLVSGVEEAVRNYTGSHGGKKRKRAKKNHLF
jgi:trk system potassium uptake protein TrkA